MSLVDSRQFGEGQGGIAEQSEWVFRCLCAAGRHSSW